jgi:two-component sensor histidine kinase
MIFHELATNSVKHGALSCEQGMLNVTTTADSDFLSLNWVETGGPSVDGVPSLQSFGSKMIERCLRQQLDGSISYDWLPTGLVATMTMRKTRLVR